MDHTNAVHQDTSLRDHTKCFSSSMYLMWPSRIYPVLYTQTLINTHHNNDPHQDAPLGAHIMWASHIYPSSSSRKLLRGKTLVDINYATNVHQDTQDTLFSKINQEI